MDFMNNTMTVRGPQLGGELSGIAPESLGGEVLADARDVTKEDGPGRGVGFWLYDLGEVDQSDLSIPIQDVVRR